MAKKRKLPPGTPEYAVYRETLMEFFRPPVSESTFCKLQKEGYIVPVEGVSGRYRLNLSLVRMGLEALASLPQGEDAGDARARITRLALRLVAPDAIESPSWLLTRDPTPEEQERAVLLWHDPCRARRGRQATPQRSTLP